MFKYFYEHCIVFILKPLRRRLNGFVVIIIFGVKCMERENSLGITNEMVEKAEKHGISYIVLYGRIKSGWDIETAMTKKKKDVKGMKVGNVYISREELQQANVKNSTVRSRIKKGYTKEEALMSVEEFKRKVDFKPKRYKRRTVNNDFIGMPKEKRDREEFLRMIGRIKYNNRVRPRNHITLTKRMKDRLNEMNLTIDDVNEVPWE